MFISSIAAFFSEVITFNNVNKYEITKIKKIEGNNFLITCYIISQKIHVDLTLVDIMKNDKLKYFKTKDIIKLTKMFSHIQDGNANLSQDNFKYLSILTYSFIVIYLISNLAATKLVNFMNITFSGGMITFPMLYIINDIITEVYGLRYIRKTILYALITNFILTFSLYMIALLPTYNNDANHQAFNTIFMLAPKIFVASITSYLTGELLNSYLLSAMKKYFKGKYFGVRALVSTIFGSLIDTSIFFLIVFTNIISNDTNIIYNILVLSVVKVVYELLLLPIAIYLVNYFKIYENIG